MSASAEKVDRASFESVKANLFPGAHEAIGDWTRFPWHRDSHGAIQTFKLKSSQALAIDVFGSIQASDERVRILSDIARKCSVPDEGPWHLQLEWTDPDRLLNEPRPTQVDAIAFGKRSILIIECKFTEEGGGCSQTKPISSGANAGLRQCNGSYALQRNPINGRVGYCALTEKGIRYWDLIPEIYGLDPKRELHPCPFKGDAYQWMRNVVLADRLAKARGVSAAVIAAYADADNLATAKKVKSGGLGVAPKSGARTVIPMSYQSIVKLAQSLSGRPKEWEDLGRWIDRKISTVSERSR